jgi:hypothetical protein
VKNLAKLILSFTVSFIVILVLGALTGLLRSWAGAAVLFPQPDAPVPLAALASSLPAAFYFSLLLGISYSSRRRIPYPVSLIALLVLSLGLSAAASAALNRLEKMSRYEIQAASGARDLPSIPVHPGLILTVTPGNAPTQAVLLGNTLESGRVLSLPGQPLYFEPAPASSGIRQIRFPFREEQSPFLAGLAADFGRSSRGFEAWFEAGFLPFAVYAGSLSLFLISIGCLANISFWPLANLFFGALAFRGILALESFLNTAEIHQILSSFAGRVIPESLINPLIFTVLGILILLYSGLVYLARGRRSE